MRTAKENQALISEITKIYFFLNICRGVDTFCANCNAWR